MSYKIIKDDNKDLKTIYNNIIEKSLNNFKTLLKDENYRKLTGEEKINKVKEIINNVIEESINSGNNLNEVQKKEIFEKSYKQIESFNKNINQSSNLRTVYNGIIKLSLDEYKILSKKEEYRKLTDNEKNNKIKEIIFQSIKTYVDSGNKLDDTQRNEVYNLAYKQIEAFKNSLNKEFSKEDYNKNYKKFFEQKVENSFIELRDLDGGKNFNYDNLKKWFANLYTIIHNDYANKKISGKSYDECAIYLRKYYSNAKKEYKENLDEKAHIFNSNEATLNKESNDNLKNEEKNKVIEDFEEDVEEELSKHPNSEEIDRKELIKNIYEKHVNKLYERLKKNSYDKEIYDMMKEALKDKEEELLNVIKNPNRLKEGRNTLSSDDFLVKLLQKAEKEIVELPGDKLTKKNWESLKNKYLKEELTSSDDFKEYSDNEVRNIKEKIKTRFDIFYDTYFNSKNQIKDVNEKILTPNDFNNGVYYISKPLINYSLRKGLYKDKLFNEELKKSISRNIKENKISDFKTKFEDWLKSKHQKIIKKLISGDYYIIEKFYKGYSFVFRDKNEILTKIIKPAKNQTQSQTNDLTDYFIKYYEDLVAIKLKIDDNNLIKYIMPLDVYNKNFISICKEKIINIDENHKYNDINAYCNKQNIKNNPYIKDSILKFKFKDNVIIEVLNDDNKSFEEIKKEAIICYKNYKKEIDTNENSN